MNGVFPVLGLIGAAALTGAAVQHGSRGLDVGPDAGLPRFDRHPPGPPFAFKQAGYAVAFGPKDSLHLWLSPTDFLSLAASPPDGDWGGKRNPEKIAKYAERMAKAKPPATFPIPWLYVHPSPTSGDARAEVRLTVSAHEGRHRAAAALQLGIPAIPVILVWGGQGDVRKNPDAAALLRGEVVPMVSQGPTRWWPRPPMEVLVQPRPPVSGSRGFDRPDVPVSANTPAKIAKTGACGAGSVAKGAFYHVTATKNVPSILQYGLEPATARVNRQHGGPWGLSKGARRDLLRGRSTFGAFYAKHSSDRVFLAMGPGAAMEWANLVRSAAFRDAVVSGVTFEPISILRVDLSPTLRRRIKVDPLGHGVHPCSFYIPGPVPPEQVQVDEELTQRWMNGVRKRVGLYRGSPARTPVPSVLDLDASRKKADRLATLFGVHAATMFDTRAWRRDNGVLRAWGEKRGMRLLGAGESRAVFTWPPGRAILHLDPFDTSEPRRPQHAIKFAYSSYGEEANRWEATIWRDGVPSLRPLLVPVVDVDPIGDDSPPFGTGGKWLVMPLVERAPPGPVPMSEANCKRLEACGIIDVRHTPNFSVDGRVLDYGKVRGSGERGGSRCIRQLLEAPVSPSHRSRGQASLPGEGMNGRDLLLGGLGALAMAGVVRRRGSRSEQDAPSLNKISVPGVTVHPRSEWPTGIRTRTGTYGACPGDLHTTQGLVYADLVATKEREIRDVLGMTPEQRAALHGCDWVPAEHAGMPGVSVVRVRGRWWVYDGHHGLAAYRRLGIEPIVWRATLATNGDPIAAPRLYARRTGSRSEWAELGRAGLPAGHAPSIQKLVRVVSLAKLAAIWRDREGGASGALVAWVEISLGAGPSYREGIPIDDVLDRMRDWAWGESDAIAVERCHEELVLLAKHFNRLSFPLTVYRGLEVHPRTIVNVQEPGDHWTPNRAVALAFATGRHQSSHRERTRDDSGEPVLLSGTISGPHAVRWRETFNGYFDYTVDHADDPEIAEQQVATSLVRDVQVVPLSTPGKKRKKRTAGSRATIRAKAQRFDAMIDGTGTILPHIPSWPAVQRHLKNDLQFETDSDYGTTFKDMVLEAFDTLKRRQPEARNTPASGRAPTRQNTEALAWEWVQGRYDDFVTSAARFTDPLVLYREVTARRHSDIRIDSLGVFWSWDPEAAEAHWSRGGENWLLVASVSAQYVDWMATATANVTMPYEREITLIPGSPVLLLRIRSDAGAEVVDEWGTA